VAKINVAADTPPTPSSASLIYNVRNVIVGQFPLSAALPFKSIGK